MDVKLDKWFRPKIDKEVLRKLSKKSDLKGILHVGIYFCFLIIKVYLLIILGVHGGQYFGFMFMETFIVFATQYGMRQDTKLHLRQKLLMNFFIIWRVLWHILSQLDGDLLILFIMEILIQQKILMIMKLNMTII